MLRKVLIILGLLVALFAIIAALQPAHFKVERSLTIAAPDSVIFAQVNDLHNWNAWSPWAKLDPAMKETYEGAAAGAGASYSWAGNSKVGEGRMTILESTPSSLVRIQLQFLKPFAATDTSEFSFTPAGKGTTVRWAMTGDNNFMAKAIGLFASMDKMVGKDFEMGLSQLKTVTEAAAAGGTQ